MPSPSLSWIRLRRSTAPRESTPASISGTSPSTDPPAIVRSMSSTLSKLTRGAAVFAFSTAGVMLEGAEVRGLAMA
eukprot:914103-Prymnesium_polylepis.1